MASVLVAPSRAAQLSFLDLLVGLVDLGVSEFNTLNVIQFWLGSFAQHSRS